MDKKKILLVEDDTALAAVYRSRLELEGFEINEVNNGEDALSAAISFKPDLILLDAMMPKISGFDVLDILRNTPETTNIRVIMLTALSQPKDKARRAVRCRRLPGKISGRHRRCCRSRKAPLRPVIGHTY